MNGSPPAGQPNYLLLTEAVSTLRESLRPYVEQQLRGAGAGWWKDYVLPNVSPLSREKLPQQPVRGAGAPLGSLDLADLLQLVIRNWATVFRGRLTDTARAYAQELYDTRNLWAHKGDGDVTRAAAERAIDTAALLLDGIDRRAAAAMRALKTRGSSPPSPPEGEGPGMRGKPGGRAPEPQPPGASSSVGARHAMPLPSGSSPTANATPVSPSPTAAMGAA